MPYNTKMLNYINLHTHKIPTKSPIQLWINYQKGFSIEKTYYLYTKYANSAIHLLKEGRINAPRSNVCRKMSYISIFLSKCLDFIIKGNNTIHFIAINHYGT